MAWRDQYRPGSFRGVPFVTVQHSADLGRRGDTHEFPERDTPYREDLGRAARRWSVQAFVIGADYMAGRDALIAAIEAPGPGALVHPFLGSFQAAVDSCHLTESTTEGGMARFDLSFVEPGSDLAAAQSADTAQASKDVADATRARAAARFDTQFKTAEQTKAVVDRALRTVGVIGRAAAIAASALSGSGSPLMALQAGIALLGTSGILAPGSAQLLGIAGDVLGDASYLAAATISVIDALGRLGSSSASIGAVQSVAAAAAALPPVAVGTPSRVQQGLNQQAIVDLVAVVAGGVLVSIVADDDYASYDDAVAVRDQIGQWLDDQAVAAADRDNRSAAADLDELRRALVADVTARGGSLARLFAYSPAIVSPALVIAWRLYRQPEALLHQTADLVARNRVRHPGFVPAAPLQMPTVEASRGV